MNRYLRSRIVCGLVASTVLVGLAKADLPSDLNAIDRRAIPEAGATEHSAPAVDVSWVPTSRVYVYGDCSSLFALAMDAGWTWVDWPTLVWIMGSRDGHGESGCQNDAHRQTGRDNSYGLLQINTKGRLWTHPIGWGAPSLPELCGLTAREDLFDVATNLRCGRLLFEVRGWKPWQ